MVVRNGMIKIKGQTGSCFFYKRGIKALVRKVKLYLLKF